MAAADKFVFLLLGPSSSNPRWSSAIATNQSTLLCHSSIWSPLGVNSALLADGSYSPLPSIFPFPFFSSAPSLFLIPSCLSFLSFLLPFLIQFLFFLLFCPLLLISCLCLPLLSVALSSLEHEHLCLRPRLLTTITYCFLEFIHNYLQVRHPIHRLNFDRVPVLLGFLLLVVPVPVVLCLNLQNPLLCTFSSSHFPRSTPPRPSPSPRPLQPSPPPSLFLWFFILLLLLFLHLLDICLLLPFCSLLLSSCSILLPSFVFLMPA